MQVECIKYIFYASITYVQERTDPGNTVGDCKCNVKDIICAYDEETSELPMLASSRGNDSSALATLPETVDSSRHKVTDMTPLKVYTY